MKAAGFVSGAGSIGCRKLCFGKYTKASGSTHPATPVSSSGGPSGCCTGSDRSQGTSARRHSGTVLSPWTVAPFRLKRRTGNLFEAQLFETGHHRPLIDDSFSGPPSLGARHESEEGSLQAVAPRHHSATPSLQSQAKPRQEMLDFSLKGNTWASQSRALARLRALLVGVRKPFKEPGDLMGRSRDQPQRRLVHPPRRG